MPPRKLVIESNRVFADDGEIRHRGIRVLASCEHCGMPLPLAGPTLQADCAHCQETNRFTPEQWQELLEQADSEGQSFTIPGKFDVDVDQQPPPTMLTDSATDPPDWLGPLVPSLRRCFGILPPVQAEEGAAAVRADKGPRPVSMNCPQCGAPLQITEKMPRTCSCQSVLRGGLLSAR